MRSLTLTVLMLAAPAAAAPPRDQPLDADLKGYYDKAFTYYVDGDYQKAIEQWNMVLREDPKQTTARNMIDEARRKMAGSAGKLKNEFMGLVDRGRYQDALLKLEELLATDPTNPYYLRAQSRLQRIAGTVRASRRSAAWRAAEKGISAWLGGEEDLPFAYDALRYAEELAPAEKAFPSLVADLERESPQLKLNDTKPPGTPVLEHKKDLALQDIYDTKYYLAVKELEEVLRLAPDDLTALKRLGSAYLQLKDYPRARRAWQKALRLSPDDDQLKQYLAALDRLKRPAGGSAGGAR